MNAFNTTTEKLDFLKKYKLISETATETSEFYYFKPGSNTPVACEVIGYDADFGTWASVMIEADHEKINIHSDYLSDMKKRGRAFHKNRLSDKDNENNPDSYVVIDIETTGFSHKNDSIIEIAAIKCTDQTIYEFSKLVKTVSTVPPNITKLTGITSEMLDDADTLENILPEFIKFIGNCKLVGHNIKAFDILFINKACNDLGLPRIKNELIDTLTLARKSLPQLDNHSLSTICTFYGVDSSDAHRALADCYMCNECYKILKQT